MKAASHELYVCTDDGSYGHHGFVNYIGNGKKNVVKLVFKGKKFSQS